jgi:predicted phosphodiesterase
MKAAVFSDVHGNLIALDAVLADAADAGVDEYWVAGDLVAHGPHSAATIRRLMELPNARFVRGNTDRYVLTGQVSAMIPADDPKMLAAAACSFAWTRGAVTSVGGYDWLAGLPVEWRAILPDGTHVLMVHASPGLDDGPGLHESSTDAELLDAGVAEAGAQLTFVGHTHRPMDRVVAGVRVVNLGSVSLPVTDERRAMWTLLEAHESGFQLEHRFADYDIEAVRSALDTGHHPSANWLKGKFQGAAAT